MRARCSGARTTSASAGWSSSQPSRGSTFASSRRLRWTTRGGATRSCGHHKRMCRSRSTSAAEGNRLAPRRRDRGVPGVGNCVLEWYAQRDDVLFQVDADGFYDGDEHAPRYVTRLPHLPHWYSDGAQAASDRELARVEVVPRHRMHRIRPSGASVARPQRAPRSDARDSSVSRIAQAGAPRASHAVGEARAYARARTRAEDNASSAQ